MLKTGKMDKIAILEKALIVFLILAGCYDVYFVLREGLTFYDFNGQWALCAYAVRGIDPYPLVGEGVPFLEQIGTIPESWRTTPWGLLLGNIFYPGFLSLIAGEVYFIAANIILLLLVVVSMFYKFREMPKKFVYTAAALALSSSTFWMSVQQGNAGGMICCLLILVCLWHKDYPILSGIVLSFAMVKPQIALIVCFSFLLKKQIKPLIIAAVIDVGAWGGASALLKVGMIELLQQFLSVNILVSGEYPYMGIFTLLLLYLKNPQTVIVMLLSMIAGVVFVLLLSIKINKSEFISRHELLPFYPAFMAVTFWCYAWNNDKFVLFVPTLICIWMMMTTENKAMKLLWFVSGVFCHLQRYMLQESYKLINLFFPELGIMGKTWYYGMTLCEICLIVIGIILAYNISGFVVKSERRGDCNVGVRGNT